MEKNNDHLSQVESARIRQRLSNNIKEEAKLRGVSVESLQYHLVFECLLRRLFDDADGSLWALKGGAALLMRHGQGRFTKDIDLARLQGWNDTQQVEDEIAKIVARKAADPFTFEVAKTVTRRGHDPTGYEGRTVEMTLIARIGEKVFRQFTIDVTEHRHTQEPAVPVSVEEPLLDKVYDQEDSGGNFYVYATPIESHLADKICAMYQVYNGRASTRYRDLVDIVTIISTSRFSVEKLRSTLSHEAARRKMELPARMEIPSPEWEAGYEKNAKNLITLPAELRPLQESLNYAGKCLNGVLSGALRSGEWNNSSEMWE